MNKVLELLKTHTNTGKIKWEWNPSETRPGYMSDGAYIGQGQFSKKTYVFKLHTNEIIIIGNATEKTSITENVKDIYELYKYIGNMVSKGCPYDHEIFLTEVLQELEKPEDILVEINNNLKKIIFLLEILGNTELDK